MSAIMSGATSAVLQHCSDSRGRARRVNSTKDQVQLDLKTKFNFQAMLGEAHPKVWSPVSFRSSPASSRVQFRAGDALPWLHWRGIPLTPSPPPCRPTSAWGVGP